MCAYTYGNHHKAPTATEWEFEDGNNDSYFFTFEMTEGLVGMTGIEAIEANDENAPAEYFNLQGVKVANPANGLFIRRQGSKVEKVVIR